MKKRKLPIDEILPGLAKELASHASVVLQAPPGAGKTTGVPLALLDAPFLKGKKIVMLEPRRLAARNAARRMAQTLGEKVGETVGYRIRMEKKISPKTRIEVVTEGILTRIIQNDPELNAFGLIIFDEFHERNISSDLGLALCLESQAALRDDLKILVMSATLDAQPVAELLDGAPILTSEGRSFPIETRYLGLTSPHAPKREVEAACTRAVIRAFQEDVGDILVFLPGAGEIRRVQKRLQTTLGEKALICPLFGALSQKEQDAAISPSLGSHRKIVLATAIAETSLTLDGVRIVVDSGLMRVHRFSPGSGMGKLETTPVSKASADQRRGRAGRTEPGVCYRLWRREETPMLQPFTAPEISVADLAPLALELALWGVSRAEELSWLTLPPPSALKQANGLLQSLGALDQSFRITAHGKAMAKAGIHPRLAHMVLMGKAKGKGAEASLLSVILTEKLSRAMGGEKDLASIMEDLLGNKKTAPHLFKLAREIAGRFGIKGEPTCTRSAGWLVSLAFPDRIAKQRKKGSQEYLMASGGGAFFDKPCPLSAEELIAIADLDGDKTRSRIYLAAPLREEEIFELHGSRIKEEESVIWNNALARVEALFKERLGAITLKERNITPSPEAITQGLLEGIQMRGMASLPWSPKAKSLQKRVLFLKNHGGFDALPDLSDTTLVKTLDHWLAPFLHGIKSLKSLERVDLHAALLTLVPFDLQRKIDELAPTHLAIPSGARVPLDYGEGEPPILAARIQQLFGLTHTPRVADGKVKVICHLLSPASRPMQVTQDLASFWKNTYPEVKKDLKGRYPKHPWPDNPLTAPATNRAKPRTQR